MPFTFINKPACCTQNFLLLVLICGSVFLSGCGTLQNGRRWGEDAFSSPTLEKIGQSAYRALVDWQTLVPAAGALIFTIDHFDNRVSDWAGQHHPIFGSQSGAKTASDVLYAGTYLEAIGTALATPSGEDSKDWERAKAKGLGVELLAVSFRPNGGDYAPITGDDPPLRPRWGSESIPFGPCSLRVRQFDSFQPEPGLYSHVR